VNNAPQTISAIRRPSAALPDMMPVSQAAVEAATTTGTSQRHSHGSPRPDVSVTV
jgi:hypothetical protein